MALSSLSGLLFKIALTVSMSPSMQADCRQLGPLSLPGDVTTLKAKLSKDSLTMGTQPDVSLQLKRKENYLEELYEKVTVTPP